MSPREYIPGDTVFAKLKGYPWWPARIENDKEIPPYILKQKGKTKGLLYTVFFYGSRDYGFFGPDCIRPFDRESVERDLKDKKFKTKDLETAVHQALDPSLLKAEEEAEAAAEEEDEDEDEAEEEGEEESGKAADDDDVEAAAKPKKRERKKPAPNTAATDKKKKAPTPKKRAGQKRIVEDEDEDEDGEDAASSTSPLPAFSSSQQKKSKVSTKKSPSEKNKRARLADPESAPENDRKKRRKSLSTEQEEDHVKRETSTASRKSEEPNNHNAVGHIEKQEDLDAFKKTPEYKKIYHIRHKLQKLVYEKKAGEIQKDDFVRVSQVIKEIEDSQMTYDLLRYTKIGKVVKFACSYDYGEDEHKINQRCQQLMKNWKSLIISEPRSASAEQHEQQS
ncbi:hypothetical protein [Parasitella parasitica]|uniref:PWWP domain-containing protein n=1 Tax=Parasitella parasitica TaxID=35722 RepID=A0A0B7MYA1_9FUNG|nr:hypothetical protein [Parasitella parasitica]